MGLSSDGKVLIRLTSVGMAHGLVNYQQLAPVITISIFS
jgi:hypothetical protein